jgi:hypothetical protein
MSKFISLLKEPSVYFLLMGIAIFVVYDQFRAEDYAELDHTIEIDGATQDWLYSNFKKQLRRSPTRAEMNILIEKHVESEIKYRHALDMGLDDRDSIIRRRMMQKFDFLFGNAAADSLPDDDVLNVWYAENPDDFKLPPALSFSHLYFSPDKRSAPFEDAATALKALRAGLEPDADRFPFDVEFVEATPREVRNVLGPEFSASVFEAEVGSWTGPIQSGLGVHLVRISEKRPGVQPPLEEVRDAVLQQWREEESERILEELILTLSNEFTIMIDRDALAEFDYAPTPEAAMP